MFFSRFKSFFSSAPKSKPVPLCTAKVFFPPNEDYRYFERAAKFPFEFNAVAFSPINAWWLAESALLAYADAAFARRRFLREGFRAMKVFGKDSQVCFVAHTDDFIIVSFRGTEVRPRKHSDSGKPIWQDFLTDINLVLTDLNHDDRGGKVHRGFKAAFLLLWHDKGLRNYLDALRLNNRRRHKRVWFTGHSLGGALAAIAASVYEETAGLYTIASPRVGDAAFKARITAPAYRLVNHNDLMCKIPPSLGYEHIGELKCFDARGNLAEGATESDIHAKDMLAQFSQLTEAVWQAWQGKEWVVPFDFIANHAPLYYAIHTWNHLVKSR
ncbi:MAG: lipase family protein [Rhizobacter sp.]|nr:lipase family protein [Chlorobiales bacterium]